jgi:uncharacterized protein (DUF1684 family)
VQIGDVPRRWSGKTTGENTGEDGMPASTNRELVRGGLAVRCLTVLGGLVIPATGCVPDLPPPDPEEHRAGVLEWHTERIAELRQPDSWFSLVGLFWLEEGESTFGADSSNDLVFPATAPPRIGQFVRTGATLRMVVEPRAAVLHDGTPVTSVLLTPQVGNAPTVAAVGPLSWYVIERQGLFGIRLKDAANPAIAAFEGIETFPVSPAWNIPARFDRHDPPRIVEIPTVLGTISEEPSPGTVTFRVDGRRYRLAVTGDPEGEEFFIVFGDQTNGEETYGGGRFLEVRAPDREGRTFIDFNRAYNPPCVFTIFATCPLPTPENRLPVRIEAGEKMWDGGGHGGATGAMETADTTDGTDARRSGATGARSEV